MQAVCIIQTLDDAEALLFLDKNFNELFNRMPADEVAAVCKRELSRLSQVGAGLLGQRNCVYAHDSMYVYLHVGRMCACVQECECACVCAGP
jgi:hypothetical protein